MSYENIVVSKSCSEKVVVLDLDKILVRYENIVVSKSCSEKVVVLDL